MAVDHLNNFYWESRQVQRANHRNLMTLNCHCQKVDLFELGAGKDVRQGGRAETGTKIISHKRNS